jgi:hypothetical protein
VVNQALDCGMRASPGNISYLLTSKVCRPKIKQHVYGKLSMEVRASPSG